MASVNKVIVVGNIGRDWTRDPVDLFGFHRPILPHIPSPRAQRALQNLERFIAQGCDAREPEVAIRKILKDLKPLLAVLERWALSRNSLTPEQLAALLDDRARLLDILEDLIRVNALPVTLQAAQMRKRLTNATSQSSSCKLHWRSSSQHRARDARYSLFRYSHFLPASAALIALH